MQTKKKATVRNSRELASPKNTRHQKKVSENAQVQAKKVADLITSSARKQKVDGPSMKKNENYLPAANLESRFGSIDEDVSTVCLEQYAEHGVNVVSINNKDFDDESAPQPMGTIFSPAFHISGNVGLGVANGEILKLFRHGEQHYEDSVHEDITGLDVGGGLSSEASNIYVSMQNSKLECVDDYNQDHMSADVEDEEYEEYDDFDPYVFIKNLPDLLTVVPAFRPMLLPKQTRSCPTTTLVLDLDETLVHSSLEPCDDADFTFPVHFNQEEHRVYVRCRPYLRDFMERASRLFEIIIFTASQSIYAEQLLNVLDPKRKIFRHRVFRESCVLFDGNYLKDLSVLGRDLSRVIIVDNSPQAFGFQVDNGIPIESWFEDRSDKELLLLLPFLESLVGVDDVRPLIAKKFNLREKIAASGCPFRSDLGDPLER